MPINWQDKAVQDRLLTAVIASVDNTIQCKEIARLYGEDMTYNAVENYLRKFRKEAKDMKAQAAGREAPVPSPARPKAKKGGDASPTKAAAGVKTGRVTKKKAPAVKVKAEAVNDDFLEGLEMNEDGGLAPGGSEDEEEV